MTNVMITEQLRMALRKDGSRYTVPGSLPVLFFGDICKATVATVGLNPSWQEYLDPYHYELEGTARRFHTLRSLNAKNRATLTDAQADQALEYMRTYYDREETVYRWFSGLTRVLEGMGYSYTDHSAVHLDLVQEATDPTWSEFRSLDKVGHRELLKVGLEFLRWQIESFGLDLIVCNGRTVLRHVARLFHGTPTHEGRLCRINWSTYEATVGDRIVSIVGWNIPLARPTGLGSFGESELGRCLAAQILGRRM